MMARRQQDAIETYMSITGASEATAVKKLQTHAGDVNEAVNAYFSEGEHVLTRPYHDESFLLFRTRTYHDEAPQSDWMEQSQPPEMEVRYPAEPFPTIPTNFPANRPINRGFMSSPTFDGRSTSRMPFRNSIPRVSHPRNVRTIPIELKDEEGQLADQNSAPAIEEVYASVRAQGPEVRRTAIFDDDDELPSTFISGLNSGSDDDELPSTFISGLNSGSDDDELPSTASSIFVSGSNSGSGYYSNSYPYGREHRSSAPQVTEEPIAAIEEGNAIEEEMLQAAIKASAREAEEANMRQQRGLTIDQLGSGVNQITPISDDNDFARAITFEDEDPVLDLSRFKFDQYKNRISQERREYLAREPRKPISVTTERHIVTDTTANPVAIASAGSAFSAATEKNVELLVNEVKELKENLANAEQVNEKLCAEIQILSVTSSRKEDFQAAALEEIRILEDVMKQVYDEMIILHKAMSSLPEMQGELKGKGALVKQAIIATDRIYGWSMEYPDAPAELAKKNRMSTERDKVRIRMSLQSHEKLGNDMGRTLSGYQMLHSALESLVKLHTIASIGELGVMRPEQEIRQEIQEMLNAMKQDVAQDDLVPSKETIVKHIVEPTKLHTKLSMLLGRIQAEMKILLPDAIECEMRFDGVLSNKVRSVAAEYKAWHAYLTEKLQVETPHMEFMKLVA